MEHIHLLDQDQTGRDQDRDQDQGGQDQDQDQDQQGRDQDQDLKKVVLIGLETKTRSRDPHPWGRGEEEGGEKASGTLLQSVRGDRRHCP